MADELVVIKFRSEFLAVMLKHLANIPLLAVKIPLIERLDSNGSGQRLKPPLK